MWERGYDAVVHRNFHPYYTGKKLIFFFLLSYGLFLPTEAAIKFLFKKKKEEKLNSSLSMIQ